MTGDRGEGAAAPLKIFIVAAEESGDRLGGALIRAIRARAGEAVIFAGVGGREMAAQGIASPFAIDDLAIIGVSAVARRLPMILRRIRETTQAVHAVCPDVLVIIDSPDFTHRIARRVRKAAPKMPIVDYVSPSIWAWRPGRARAMRAYIDHVLALLPFEPEAHRRLGGPACTYVGHPLVEQIEHLRPAPEEMRRRQSEPPRVLILPGSRASEIARHLAVFGAAMQWLEKRYGPIELVLPTVPHLQQHVQAQTANWPNKPRIVVDPREKWAAFRTARAALAASGTVTLELALAGVPTVVAYKVSWLEELIARLLIRVPTIVLANLVLGENAMPELLQRHATPARLADAMAPLLGDTPERARQLEAFAKIDAVMGIGLIRPSEAAADVVLQLARRARISNR